MASIRKRGNRWQARILRTGYPNEIKTFSTKAEAEVWARQIESKMDQCQFISRSFAEQTTFGQIIQRYIETVTPSKRGRVEETTRLKATLRHRIAKLSMANLTPQEMASYRDDRLRSCQPNTVIRDLSALSSIINHARREWGVAVSNPIEMIRKPQMPPGRDFVLTDEDEQNLLRELAPIGRRNPLMQPLVVLAIETAMRRGELLGLQWRHINLSRRTIYLPLTKNGESRHVPLSSRAVATLREIPNDRDVVFPISIAAMEAAFLRAVKRTDLNGLHFHDLRHTGTSRMANKLPNVIELAAVTGHRSIQMLKRYYHPKAEDLALKLG